MSNSKMQTGKDNSISIQTGSGGYKPFYAPSFVAKIRPKPRRNRIWRPKHEKRDNRSCDRDFTIYDCAHTRRTVRKLRKSATTLIDAALSELSKLKDIAKEDRKIGIVNSRKTTNKKKGKVFADFLAPTWEQLLDDKIDLVVKEDKKSLKENKYIVKIQKNYNDNKGKNQKKNRDKTTKKEKQEKKSKKDIKAKKGKTDIKEKKENNMQKKVIYSFGSPKVITLFNYLPKDVIEKLKI